MPIKTYLLILLALAAFTAQECSAAPQFPGDLPGTNIGGQLGANYEVSGAAWHAGLQRLIVVSDEGFVSQLEANGDFATTSFAGGGDLEAVCVADETSEFVYLGREHPDAVMEYNLQLGTITRIFPLTATMTGANNLGLEALTFVPDANDPEGGLFHAGKQDNGKVYVFRLPIVSSSTSTASTHITTYTPVPGRDDISGLDYDRGQGRLFAIFDSHNRISQMTPAGVLVQDWALPGNDQEGVAVRGCELFVVSDVGGNVWKYTSFPDLSGCHALSADTSKISLSQGGQVTFTLRAADGLVGNVPYIVAGSASGDAPGLSFPAFTWPLNPDAYFQLSLAQLNAPPFTATSGILPPSAPTSAALTVPPNLPSSLAGLVLHHAFVTLHPTFQVPTGASYSQVVTLVP